MIKLKAKELALSFVITFGAAAIGSLATFPNLTTWYAALQKPTFNPPNWVFGPVWTILYILIALSLYIVWTTRTKQQKRGAYIAFGVQLALNALWSIVFFGLHWPALAVVVIVALLGSIAATIWQFCRISRLAGWLLASYICWVAFATALTVAVAWLN
ncbi:MAG TPA: TspO/MBR family protein [Candidatus Saccharimonas sp.]|nr:TspO/MBR family protein [Candidatus Saccharimonas sp.]